MTGTDEYDNPLSGKNYILYNDKGEVIKTGVLDEEGRTSVLYDNLEKEYYIYIVDVGFNKIKSVQYDQNS